MEVTAKWELNYVEFRMDFEDDRPLYVKFCEVENHLFTDERDDCNGSAKWHFFVPDVECDEELRLIRTWFRDTDYMEVFHTLDLCEGTVPKAPGYAFRKTDLWHYWNDVLIVVQRVAMDI